MSCIAGSNDETDLVYRVMHVDVMDEAGAHSNIAKACQELDELGYKSKARLVIVDPPYGVHKKHAPWDETAWGPHEFRKVTEVRTPIPGPAPASCVLGGFVAPFLVTSAHPS